MKFRVMMKDPDGIYECMRDAANLSADDARGLSSDEREALVASRLKKLDELASRWFEFGDYCQLEIDTEAETIRVVPVGEPAQ